MKKILFSLFLPACLYAQRSSFSETDLWERQAKNVTIIRDNWGIPHIYGKTDANAVFGLMFAQCEDDFKRVEMNYIEKLGRMAEVNGESSLYDYLLIRMIIDSADAVKDYNNSPAWLKKLCNAFADGINYYLYTNPNNKPVLLTRFKPWCPFLWTDGSIGAINFADVKVSELKNSYSGEPPGSFKKPQEEEILTGSNGFAFSPKITGSGNSILYIDPHVTFYFCPEVHIVSEEASPDGPVGRGLNAYGALTWEQFSFTRALMNTADGCIHPVQ